MNLLVRGPASRERAHPESAEVLVTDREDVNAVLDFVANVTRRILADSHGADDVFVKLVVPSHSGFVARSDFLRLRMVGYPAVYEVKEFVTPNQHLDLSHLQNDPKPNSLPEALRGVVGAIVLRSSPSDDFAEVAQRLDSELTDRLAFPWILPTPITSGRLFIAGHRHPAVMAGYMATAYALGIRVTLIDGEGEFLPPESRSGAVESCIVIDKTADDQLSSRIVEAVKSANTECGGIVTFTDTWRIPVAEAAVALGLPSFPVELVKTCLDKHATRLLCPGFPAPLRVKSLAEVQDQIKQHGLPFDYPLVVKPCTAWGSQGVFKARSEAELFDAVSRATYAAKGFDLLIDNYVDGPEVDANFVLSDGKIVFFELVDGFPCTAEVENHGKPGDFLETDQVWPSNHPQNEHDIVRSTMHSILIKLGIHNGIFHMEARIKNSTMQYRREDGVVDLRRRAAVLEDEPSAFLLEINERPPGHGGSWGAALAYGIDYPGLHMLGALRETARIQALGKPFASGARQWVDTVFVNSEAGGIYDGGDLGQELREKRPDLMAHVHYCNTYYEKGEAVTDSPARIALFVVTSTVSRKAVLEIAKQVRETVEVKMIYESNGN